MNRRNIILGYFIVLLIGLGLGRLFFSRSSTATSEAPKVELNLSAPTGVAGGMPPPTRFDKAIFVCVDNTGMFSPGVYLGGTGGQNALSVVPQAARYMRTPEVDDAAAGLCGYLYKQIGDDVAANGCLSVYDPPKPGPNGKVDWQSYCGPDTDLILIHVEQGTVELYSGSADLKSPTKSLVQTISGLKFGS